MKHLYCTKSSITHDFLNSISPEFTVKTDRALPYDYCSQRAKDLRKAVVHYVMDDHNKIVKRDIFFPNGNAKRKVY